MELTKGEWGCPHCGRGFPGHAAMSGHKRHCRPFHGALQYGQGEGDEGIEFGMDLDFPRGPELEAPLDHMVEEAVSQATVPSQSLNPPTLEPVQEPQVECLLFGVPKREAASPRSIQPLSGLEDAPPPGEHVSGRDWTGGGPAPWGS